MSVTAFGHALETIHDGLTVIDGGRPAPVPLEETRIVVEIAAGLARIRTQRRFTNAEARPIEAILTMPVGFDAVVTGLKATVDGRVMVATAKPKSEAREEYEAALDGGKLAVLHEEVLRGVHALSVGNLAAGTEVSVKIEAVMPMVAGGNGPLLRIPVTVGALYGASPLAPVDDVVASANVRHEAELVVAADAGRVLLGGRPFAGPQRITLDAAIEIEVQGGVFGAHSGVAADGRQVRVDLRPVAAGSGALDLAVLVDHSGSTGGKAPGSRGLTVWEAMRDGLRLELGRLRAEDRVALWQFDGTCDKLGNATGNAAAALVAKLAGPAGGTALGRAVETTLRSGARDILVLTDGQTWASTVDDFAQSKARISAILVGAGSLDANIGQLCAMTGGQVFYAPGDDVAASLSLALAALRRPGTAAEGTVSADAPERILALRGGTEIRAVWSEAMEMRGADAVGRFAAALSLPLLEAEAGEAWARAHGLCTHRTSLVLVDEAGQLVEGMAQQRKVPLMAAMRVPLDPAASYPSVSSPGIRFMSVSREAGPARVERSRLGFLTRSENAEWLWKARAKDRGTAFGIGGIVLHFGSVRWDILGDAVLCGDWSTLDAGQMRLISEVAARRGVRAFAEAAGLPVEVVALALLADALEDRLAARFVRRVAKGESERQWQALRLQT